MPTFYSFHFIPPINFPLPLRRLRNFFSSFLHQASHTHTPLRHRRQYQRRQLLEAVLHFHSFKCTSSSSSSSSSSSITHPHHQLFVSKNLDALFSRIKSHRRKHEILNSRPRGHARLFRARFWPRDLYHQELLRYRYSLCPRRQHLRRSLHHPCRLQLRTLYLPDQRRWIWRSISQDGSRGDHLL